ncbi:MAG: polysaccharide deacetylase family protein [Actinomycetota bacterium]
MSSPLRVALTFDAEHPDRPWCPPGNAERILDVLRSNGVRATFFVQGRWAQSQPAAALRIADDGHLIGHHSHYHARMPLLSDDGLDEDLSDGHAAIVAATGSDPRPWFRCPFGAGHDDPRVLARIEAAGYRDVHWDVELEDWEAHRTGEAIAADCLDGVRDHGDGAVVLLHTWPGGTGDAVGPIVAGLRELDAHFVGIDELERLP